MLNEQEVELAELAGGFIHEIKNHLSTLGLNLGLLSEDYGQPQTQRDRRALERVQRLQGECGRLVSLSNDFLRFARVKDLNLVPTSLADMVEDMLDFFGPMARQANIEIKSYLPADLSLVALDRDLYKQALLNLLLNAQQAMTAGGELTLQACREGDAVALTLIDTGMGMTPEVLAKVFRPFFSTKPGGSGLGLPTVRRILTAHGGSIDMQSAVERGTKITIHLPAHQPPPTGGRGPKEKSMEALANVNGKQLPLADVLIPALDRGFLFGDAVYEVIRVYQGRPFLLADHMDRLARSLESIRLTGVDVARLTHRVTDTIQAGSFQEALVYIQITRGSGTGRTHAFPAQATPLEFLYVQPYQDAYADLRRTGARVLTVPDIRWQRCDIKSTNLLANVLAAQAAKEADCLEAIFCKPDGTLVEGSRTSLFGVLDGQLLTAPTTNDILPGITRKLILTLADRVGIVEKETVLRRTELARVSELFLTGTTTEVMPIVRVDDQPIGSGQPGPVTQRLQQAYQEAVRGG